MPRIISFLTVFLALMAAVVTAQAQPRGQWEVLGEQRSRPGVESLKIDVPGRRAGRFDALKVAVRGGNILLLSVEITFGNGDRQKVDIRFPLTAGAETGPIDLEGRGRFIRSVRVRYGSLGFLGRPTVVVLGHPVRGRPDRPDVVFRDLGPRWERLSVERVDRERDRDVIQLSRRDGRFDAILLRVRQSPIRLRRVRVVFGNGRRQDFDLPNVLRRGDTDILELRGRRGRFIDRIVLVYRDIGSPRRARVAVFGRKAERRPDFRDLGPDWSRLSVERVNRERDRDVIQLSRRDGRFDAILLRVRQSPVRVRRVRVVFGNGRRQDFDLPNVLRRGDTDVLELRGRRGRFIDRIVLVYRDAGGPRRARVEVWGRQTQRRGFRPLGPRWDEIGIMRASRGGDRDVIELSRRDGRFDALLLRVKRNDVEFRRVRVIYGNGRRDNLDIDRRIRAGDESDVLELRGARGRFLDRIELVYRTRGGGRLALVEIWGRRSLRR
ncbi:hypothetical protein [Dichotomicrobium thermohalophilum]|uniref:Uncharacterized protein n=1 Tax=Dichotomicrobium thermohalophilum TaxID=933063 RepID=A0A397Q4D3_9HYPH|nr:hypothetical protein [Dichotomicrobium thermohalophilum]RIA56206.1 hypothetical protein BXY53_1308 [Dichotomicrobium thermohalophilum]